MVTTVKQALESLDTWHEFYDKEGIKFYLASAVKIALKKVSPKN